MKKLFKFLLFNFIVIYYLLTSKILATEISSPSAVVICEDTGRILFGKNENEKRKMASLTKLMTAIILVENCDMDEIITVPKEACFIGGSEAGIRPNDKITARDLLYSMLLPSGNDCALAIGYHIGGNISNFAKIMNKKALEIGLKNTSFANPHGLDNENHYTTAYEMALISKYAKSYDVISEAVATQNTTVAFTNDIVSLRNTNSLLRTYSKATGMKTGFTNGANRCLSASATDNGLNLIAVVLGSETSQIRFNDAITILEDTFSKYKYYDISKFLDVYIDIPVKKGKLEKYVSSYSEEKHEALTDEEYSKLYISQNFISCIEAPMYKGDYIGTYSLMLDNETLYSKNFYLNQDILKKEPIDYFIFILKNMFKKLETI